MRQIIIDCDPSPDDAVSILVALASPEELEVLAVTTVAGNVPVSLTSKNARKALELAKRTTTPVYAGRNCSFDQEVDHSRTRAWPHWFRRL